MSGSLVLLHLAGAVALLLFATRQVRTGVERAYGDVLRLRLRSILKNPLLAVGAGALLAICLQSATAVALLLVTWFSTVSRYLSSIAMTRRNSRPSPLSQVSVTGL